jgi:hypothetical protein
MIEMMIEKDWLMMMMIVVVESMVNQGIHSIDQAHSFCINFKNRISNLKSQKKTNSTLKEK